MSTEANKALVRRFIEALWGAGDPTAVDALTAADYTFGLAGAPAPLDRPGLQRFVAAFRAAFPDLRVAVEQLVGEGDAVAARWRARHPPRRAAGDRSHRHGGDVGAAALCCRSRRTRPRSSADAARRTGAGGRGSRAAGCRSRARRWRWPGPDEVPASGLLRRAALSAPWRRRTGAG